MERIAQFNNPKGPVIEQIQGSSIVYSYNHKLKHIDCMEALSNFRWEKLMLDLVETWANENGLPSSYVLPSHLSPWKEVRQKGRLRFDITAKRCGYRLDNNLYTKNLAAGDN